MLCVFFSQLKKKHLVSSCTNELDYNYFSHTDKYQIFNIQVLGISPSFSKLGTKAICFFKNCIPLGLPWWRSS